MRLKCLLCLILALALTVPVHALTFDELPDLVEERGTAYRLKLRDLATQQARLDDLLDDRVKLMNSDLGARIFTMYDTIQNQIDAVEDTIADINDRLPYDLLDSILTAQTLYIDCHLAALDVELARCAVETAERNLAVAEQKFALGILAATTVSALSDAVTAQQKSLETAEKKLLSALEALAGEFDRASDEAVSEQTQAEQSPGAEFVLGDAPAFDPDEFFKRDYDADLAAYMAHNPVLTAKAQTVADTQKALKESKTRYNQHLYQAALDDLESAQAASARDFGELYADMADAVSDYAADTGLSDAQSALDRATIRYELGFAAGSTVAAALTACRQADIRAEQQRLQLLSRYVRYLRAVAEVYVAGDGAE